MALMALRVTMTGDQPVTVKVTPKAIVLAERHFKKPMAELFQNVSYESLAWVAWQAMQAAGHVVKPFDDWLNDLEAVEAEESAPLVAGR